MNPYFVLLYNKNILRPDRLPYNRHIPWCIMTQKGFGYVLWNVIKYFSFVQGYLVTFLCVTSSICSIPPSSGCYIEKNSLKPVFYSRTVSYTGLDVCQLFWLLEPPSTIRLNSNPYPPFGILHTLPVGTSLYTLNWVHGFHSH